MSLRNTRIALISYMLLILIVSSIPGMSFPDIKILSYDKLIHIAEYSIFGILFFSSFLPLTTKRSIIILSFAILFSILDESLQSFIPGRHASSFDVIADIIGIIAGMTFVKLRVKNA